MIFKKPIDFLLMKVICVNNVQEKFISKILEYQHNTVSKKYIICRCNSSDVHTDA